jgi:hypothetical protein
LELNERAWVIPVGAQLTAPPELGKPLHFVVKFLNTGRQTAKDINVEIDNSVIDAYNPSETDMNTIAVPANTSCQNIKTVPDRPVFPPTSSGAVITQALDTIHGTPPYNAEPKMFSGDKFYVVRGCVAYMTYEKPHTSGFCYILESTSISMTVQPGQPPTITPGGGPAGNPTAPPNPTVTFNGRNFTFATCRSGFSAD